MELPDSVTVLEQGDKTYYIVGTAHISKQSVVDVKTVIDQVGPDTVCVELCQARYDALVNEDRWKNLDIFAVIKEGKTLFLLANLAVGAYQRRLGAQLGVKPGAELMAAVKKAEEIGAEVALVDRDIHATLKRTWASLKFFDKIKLIGAIVASLVSREEMAAEEIEKLKEKDQLSEMMKEFAEVMPAVQRPLIDERDQFLMSSIEEVSGEKIVAVVGAGHVEGMTRYFGQEIDRESLSIIPPKSRWKGLLKWIIPAIILAAFAIGISRNEDRNFEEMLYAWVIPNSVAAALFTIIAGGKILSIITAFIASPITSLNPLLGAGMVVGLVEAWQRKPTVQDCERINEDVKSLKGIYKNPFTRVLLVAFMSTMGSAIGSWIGLTWVLTIV
jgi:pheromone shutdown-related protein TraB